MTETLANGYSSESTHQELSNEYNHDRVSMIFKKIFILKLWTKVASALEGLRLTVYTYISEVVAAVVGHGVQGQLSADHHLTHIVTQDIRALVRPETTAKQHNTVRNKP